MKLNPLHNQVGGHDGVMSMGDDNEIIVKPCLAQELEFYEQSLLHPELKAWMPAFYGSLTLARQANATVVSTEGTGQDSSTSVSVDVAAGFSAPTIKSLDGVALETFGHKVTTSSTIQTTTNINGETVSTLIQESSSSTSREDVCICLENVSHGFTHPCVLDLKLGTQLYDDNAPEEKKARLAAVAAKTTSGKLGFRMTGFQVYDQDQGQYVKYDKQYGKSMTEESVVDGFRLYFAAKLGPKRMKLVLLRFVNDLEDFLEVIQTQELRMRSSSLLLMYEGDRDAFDIGLVSEQEAKAKAEAGIESEDDDNDEEEEDEESSKDQKVTDLRLIDFAHSAWTPGMGPDEGVVLGVTSTLRIFKLLLEDFHQ
ncbi:hypothetical protein BGZ73_009172 [Actinomortierella ambigua]|nr:hypothetical protein BGZ73_009172 [Actinomortierella ambigua]